MGGAGGVAWSWPDGPSHPRAADALPFKCTVALRPGNTLANQRGASHETLTTYGGNCGDGAGGAAPGYAVMCTGMVPAGRLGPAHTPSTELQFALTAATAAEHGMFPTFGRTLHSAGKGHRFGSKF